MLDMSREKTLVTHARTHAARFLGYEIMTAHNDRKMTGHRRTLNGRIKLRVPREAIKAKCTPYLRHGQPAARLQIVNESDHTIVATFGAEYGGIVQYYLLAGDVYRLTRLHWVMQTALLRTLAVKHGSTVTQMAGKYKTTVDTPAGLRKCIQARIEREGKKPLVAQFGGIPLRRQKKAALKDQQTAWASRPHKELTMRLLSGKCEMCGQEGANVEVHQIQKLADLVRSGQPQPAWANLMIKMRRKAIITCGACHEVIHSGKEAMLA